MRTSDPWIWAVGDAVEVRDLVSEQPALIPLAGPANRQGRIAAENILGRDSRYKATQGTAICKVFDLAFAMTGLTEIEPAPRQEDLSPDLRTPGGSRRLLPRRPSHLLEAALRSCEWTHLGGPGRRGRGRRQAHRRSCRRDPCGDDGLRSRRSRTLLRASIRQRQGRGEHGRLCCLQRAALRRGLVGTRGTRLHAGRISCCWMYAPFKSTPTARSRARCARRWMS